MPHKPSVYAAFALSVFLLASLYVQLPLAKNEIQLDFSKSPQRVGLPAFLNLHLFLHAESA